MLFSNASFARRPTGLTATVSVAKQSANILQLALRNNKDGRPEEYQNKVCMFDPSRIS